MDANDNKENDHDAAEALAYLNRIALRDLPINREEEGMQRMFVNGPIYTLLRPFSSRREAYQALLLESFHTTEGKGLY
tara:strand:- start:455 stop:688 length:234 start_codon:yes stop_codon:yes gene_type:complete